MPSLSGCVLWLFTFLLLLVIVIRQGHISCGTAAEYSIVINR